MNREAFAEGGITAVLGAVCMYEGLRLTRQPLLWKDLVGPGWYLVAVAVGLLIVSAFLLTRRTVTRAAKEVVAPSVPWWRSQPVLLMVAFIGYTAIAPFAGYVVSSFAFFSVALRIAGVSTWLRSVAIGAVITGVFYAFCLATSVPLP